jgi:vacuolar-type H+-ATPase subunit D/Vma8
MADTVQSYLHILFLKKNRLHMQIFNIQDFAKMVDVRIDVQLVQTTEHLHSHRVIVVSMDGENWHSNPVFV